MLHPDGVAILYADHVTDCRRGIDEIEWPRAKHIACNEANGVTLAGAEEVQGIDRRRL
jgi:excinuclease UvrABC helicase subunit UvrB